MQQKAEKQQRSRQNERKQAPPDLQGKPLPLKEENPSLGQMKAKKPFLFGAQAEKYG